MQIEWETGTGQWKIYDVGSSALAYVGDRERAEKILYKAESACLITNSVKSKVGMIPTITIDHKLTPIL